MPLRLIEGIRDRGSGALRLPLGHTSRALRQLPFVVEKVLEEVVAPLRGCLRPGALWAAGARVASDTGFVLALPAKPLLFDERVFRLRADQRRIAGTVGFAERVAAGNQRDGLLVVHRHAEERFAD